MARQASLGLAGDRLLGASLFAIGIPAFVLLLWFISVAAQKVTRARQRGEYGPIKWFFLFASGAKLDILRSCPEEETKYVGLGSAVVVTTSMAAVSSTISLSIATGKSWMVVWPFGIFYGGIIFLLDRFLVSQQLNPYTFERSGSSGTDAVEPGSSRWSRIDWGKPARVVLTLVSAIPRLLLAVVIGVLIAEPVLLKIFEPEVDRRIDEIQLEFADRRTAQINTFYDDKVDELLARQTATGTTSGDDLASAKGQLAALDAELQTANDKVSGLASDIVELNEILAAEIRGETICRSSGTDCSTGLPGDGNNAANRRAQIADTQRLLDDATAQRGLVQASRDAKQFDVNALQAKVDLESGTTADQAANAQIQIDAINRQRDADLAAATATASEADGLLLRIEALEDLTHGDPFGRDDSDTVDTQVDATVPSTTTSETTTSETTTSETTTSETTTSETTTSETTTSETTSSETALTEVAQTAATPATSDTSVPAGQPATATDPTGAAAQSATVDRSLNTLGITVWLLRAWILLIDIMPIVFKISLSLRSRRPYDALVGANEEKSIVAAHKIVEDAYRDLDAHRDRNRLDSSLSAPTSTNRTTKVLASGNGDLEQ